MFKTHYIIISLCMVLQGCSGFSDVKSNSPSVTSSPSGATVYANGNKLGITPLYKNLYKAFPASWNNLVYQASGALIVKKEGCDDYIMNVSDAILSNPIHVDMTCNQLIQKSTPKPVESDTPGSPVLANPSNDVEKRLLQLQSMFEKGIITQDEYRATRKRILDEM